jgi:hypothetical protein
VVDNSDEGAYIGIERTDNATSAITNSWNGYIYLFAMYVEAHTTAFTDYASTCSSGCETYAFDNLDDSTGCHGSCANRSCVRANSCRAVSECDGASFPFCHLCLDRECTKCSDYATCDIDKCANSRNA